MSNYIQINGEISASVSHSSSDTQFIFQVIITINGESISTPLIIDLNSNSFFDTIWINMLIQLAGRVPEVEELAYYLDTIFGPPTTVGENLYSVEYNYLTQSVIAAFGGIPTPSQNPENSSFPDLSDLNYQHVFGKFQPTSGLLTVSDPSILQEIVNNFLRLDNPTPFYINVQMEDSLTFHILTVDYYVDLVKKYTQTFKYQQGLEVDPTIFFTNVHVENKTEDDVSKTNPATTFTINSDSTLSIYYGKTEAYKLQLAKNGVIQGPINNVTKLVFNGVSYDIKPFD